MSLSNIHVSVCNSAERKRVYDRNEDGVTIRCDATRLTGVVVRALLFRECGRGFSSRSLTLVWLGRTRSSPGPEQGPSAAAAAAALGRLRRSP